MQEGVSGREEGLCPLRAQPHPAGSLVITLVHQRVWRETVGSPQADRDLHCTGEETGPERESDLAKSHSTSEILVRPRVAETGTKEQEQSERT